MNEKFREWMQVNVIACFVLDPKKLKQKQKELLP